MKVLLRKNVFKLGKIGEIVEVKPGYARNYLIPSGLAVEPSKNNLRLVESEKKRYLEELAARKSEFQAKADLLSGKEITISARANEQGVLYGSIGPAQLAAAIAEQNVFVEPENILLDAPIRRLDKYDVTVSFSDEVSATIHVWVVPVREEGSEQPAESSEAADETAEDE